MKKLLTLTLFSNLLFFGAANAQFSFGKIDTTLKTGKVGYRVDCKNKNIDQNQLTIRPVGFESGAREMSFGIRGRVAKTEIDDLNNDGFPDLILYIYSDSNSAFGTVYAFLSEANKSITPCALPDVMLDGKINTGYKGHDQFSLMESYLLQKFPIYRPGDDKDKPTGGIRSLLYQLVRGEDGKFKFSIVRFYDTK
jgi:hypothetical protein